MFTPPRQTLLFAGALVTALLLSSCASSSTSSQSASTSASSPVTKSTQSASVPSSPSAQTQDVFSVALGDCIDQAAVGNVTDVPTVACTSPHDLEDFYDFELTGSDFPGDSVVSDAAKAGCGAQFESFVGVAYSDSALDYTELTPTEQSWASGDRTVSCLVGDPNGKTTGSLAGAAR